MTRLAYNYFRYSMKKARREVKRWKMAETLRQLDKDARTEAARAENYRKALKSQIERSWWSITKDRLQQKVSGVMKNFNKRRQ